MSTGGLHIGTSGWSYAHWGKGVFYPRGMNSRDWLSYYASRFDTVEVNMTFYRLPNEALLAQWRDATPSRFKFAFKMWRHITHERRLHDCEKPLQQFLTACETLGSKRGPLLVQLPPSFQCDCERLDSFLRLLKQAAGRSRWRVAVEFRHRSWLCDEAYAVLNQNRAAAVLADMPECRVRRVGTASFVYMRRHGPKGDYASVYSARQIGVDAKRVREWLDANRTVYAYYNNDAEAFAPANALTLRELVE